MADPPLTTLQSAFLETLRPSATGRAAASLAAAPAVASCVMDLDWHARWEGAKPSGIACGEPSAADYTAACVHEHLDTVRICAACAVDVQYASGTLTCPHCWLGSVPHACLNLAVIEWDSGERTVVQEADRG